MDVNKNIMENLDVLNVKFKKLDKNSTDGDVWNMIFKNDFYEINQHMLESYFEKKDFWEKSYTYISENNVIKQYVDKNIEQYIELILGNIPPNSEKEYFNDAELQVVELLNNINISSGLKRKYLSRMKTCISDIYVIKDKTLWDDLLIDVKLPRTVETIMKYFYNIESIEGNEKYGILLDFINTIPNLEKLDFKNIEWRNYPNTKYDFYKFIISAQSLKSSAISIVRSASDLKYELNEFADRVKSQYVVVMIDNDLLLMTDRNCQRIIDDYNELLNIFVYKNCTIFCSFLKNGDLNLPENKLGPLLQSSNEKLENAQKMELIKSYKGKVRFNIQYSEDILLEILQHHLEDADLYRYFKMYDETTNKKTKEIIYTACKNNSYIGDFRERLESEHEELYVKLRAEGVL